ncbi:MAG: succinate--CoA ligase subunit alpha [Candidatus Thermoplasmatota archaeon]|nr:succinate--CoA ligase subunit alpha [Candidatus Thermoplasmatota archaeon]MCL5789476.1 succinate--CoA ligase subunit alpha [Candidatus Thermoplasmatota archaeon]
MSILVNEDTRILVQGITGHQGSFNAVQMQKFGSKVVAGTSPGKGGTEVSGIKVFNTVNEAMTEEPNATFISVAAPYVLDAAKEALYNGIEMIYILTEKVPYQDTMKIVDLAKKMGKRVLGPNGPGVTSPFSCKLGIMPNQIFKKGNVGVISRSGTLTYEIVNQITTNGLGESTVIGLGGDPVTGMNYIDALKEFKDDDQTMAVAMVGEIGGTAEEEAAEYIKNSFNKPVVSYITGRSAPPGKRMGHAGAIISRGKGTAESKVKALEEAGVKVASYPYEIPSLLKEVLK